ncbi:MAG: hypothetical protein E6K72_02580 [Candidatus Eisenbacteria bacterium]|uniref:Uncharacterized protein n=1 Tax=Eiseniibacteriota bacterium TaxID=2212470 RepID=A0A538T4C9_UNCEI|nr:MAG: hypothetical protein E6K72_02580 [Candidatus Eisenbacteria bacterium]
MEAQRIGGLVGWDFGSIHPRPVRVAEEIVARPRGPVHPGGVESERAELGLAGVPLRAREPRTGTLWSPGAGSPRCASLSGALPDPRRSRPTPPGAARARVATSPPRLQPPRPAPAPARPPAPTR